MMEYLSPPLDPFGGMVALGGGVLMVNGESGRESDYGQVLRWL